MTNYELYVNTIKGLASSKGMYSRMLIDFNEMSDDEKKNLEVTLNDYPQIKDTVEMCMFLEGGLDLQPQTKYGNKILAQRSISFNGIEYTCFVLDDGNYYNVHVLTEDMMDEEGNTLTSQEPKDIANLDIITSKPFMLSKIMETALWRECYCSDKMYEFSIDYIENTLD